MPHRLYSIGGNAFKLNRPWLALLAWFCGYGATPEVEVTLVHRTEAEAQTQDCNGC